MNFCQDKVGGSHPVQGGVRLTCSRKQREQKFGPTAIFSIFSVRLIIVFCLSYVLYVSYPCGATLTKTNWARQVELCPTQNENQPINWTQLQ